MIVSFWDGLFSGAFAVSFRDCRCFMDPGFQVTSCQFGFSFGYAAKMIRKCLSYLEPSHDPAVLIGISALFSGVDLQQIEVSWVLGIWKSVLISKEAPTQATQMKPH